MNNSENVSYVNDATNEDYSDEDYYRLLMENNWTKVSLIAISAASIPFIQSLSVGIILFEKFGSDEKRTLTNRLVALSCWSTVYYLILILFPQFWVYFVRPLPESCCFLLAILRNSLFYNVVLYFDLMAVIRFQITFIE